jgi:hypothetical protein
MEARAILVVQPVRVVHDLYSDLGAVREVYRLVHDDPPLCDVRPKRQGHGAMIAGIRGLIRCRYRQHEAFSAGRAIGLLESFKEGAGGEVADRDAAKPSSGFL